MPLWATMLVLVVAPASAASQTSCRGLRIPWTLDGPRLLEGAPDRGMLRRGAQFRGWSCAGSEAPGRPDPGLSPNPWALRGAYRSAYPVDRNNGAVWEGRGVSGGASGGFRWSGGPLEVVVGPTVSFQANRSFAIAPSQDPLQYPFHAVDLPQRLGTASFWTIDPGQTAAELAIGRVGAAISWEDLWWGPARRYPLLLSNTGPGSPHVLVGARRPLAIGIGTVRVQGLAARLDASRFFAPADQGARLMTGLFAEFYPSIAPGLGFGFAALDHTLWSAAPSRAAWTFGFSSDGVEADDALLSLTASWTMPESGLELYGEFGREESWRSVHDL
ncbi:MAG: hypothetical protein AB7I30_12570, partial [Isosphaeraceae bacterium]